MSVMKVAGAILSVGMLTGCGSILYLPSESVYENVVVESNEELLEQIFVSVDYCDDFMIEGVVTNNADSDAVVQISIELDDGTEPQELIGEVEAAAGADTDFIFDNETGINPIMGCSGTVVSADISE
jgi:hypothetical protein